MVQSFSGGVGVAPSGSKTSNWGQQHARQSLKLLTHHVLGTLGHFLGGEGVASHPTKLGVTLGILRGARLDAERQAPSLLSCHSGHRIDTPKGPHKTIWGHGGAAPPVPSQGALVEPRDSGDPQWHPRKDTGLNVGAHDVPGHVKVDADKLALKRWGTGWEGGLELGPLPQQQSWLQGPMGVLEAPKLKAPFPFGFGGHSKL